MPALVVPTAGLVPTAVASPPVAEESGARLVQYASFADAESAATLVFGCVASPIPGWVEDMRGPIEARTIALAGAAAERATGLPMDARPSGDRLVLRAASNPEGEDLGVARTFVGFDETNVFTCFAACTRKTPPFAKSACAHAALAARLEGGLSPPPPGASLRAVTWGIHHPAESATAIAVAVGLLAIVAVVTRRKPRSRA